MDKNVMNWTLGVVLAACCVIALLAQTPQEPAPATQQPSEIQLVISGEPGNPAEICRPRLRRPLP
jgi:hypothetical protein